MLEGLGVLNSSLAGKMQDKEMLVVVGYTEEHMDLVVGKVRKVQA